MIKIFVFLLSILLITTIHVNAQCCSAGNPVGNEISSGVLNKKSLMIGVSYKQSFSDTYYEGRKVSDYKYIDESGYQFSNINLSYGVTPKLSVKANMGYFFSKSQTFANDYKRNASGLADAELGAKYSFWQNDKKSFLLAGTANIKIPIGEFDVVHNNVKLPIDIQPSSGSFRYHFGLLFFKTMKNKKLSFMSYYAVEFAQRVQSERHPDYKYGNLYLFSYAANYSFSKSLNGSLQLRSEFRGKATDKGNVLESTGGSVVFIAPELSYMPVKSWFVSANINVPVYKKMNGIQLTNKYTFGVSLRKNIHF